jgi:hypothetical protein
MDFDEVILILFPILSFENSKNKPSIMEKHIHRRGNLIPVGA